VAMREPEARVNMAGVIMESALPARTRICPQLSPEFRIRC
jgi:hypothetical protein